MSCAALLALCALSHGEPGALSDPDLAGHHPPLLCDRPSAREARKAIKDMLLPLVRSYGAQMSSTCPLSPEHDRLAAHEQKKKPLTQYNWRCEICGKSFRSERCAHSRAYRLLQHGQQLTTRCPHRRYIDMHMDRKHLGMLSASATTCLGDFCDILRCPSWVRDLRSQLRDQPAACKRRDLDRRRHYCQHLMHDCFAPENGTVRVATSGCSRMMACPPPAHTPHCPAVPPWTCANPRLTPSLPTDIPITGPRDLRESRFAALRDFHV